MKRSPAFIIFSVSQANVKYSVNLINHNKVLSDLERSGIPYLVVNGCYQGIKEPAILISQRFESVVQELTNLYNQECYLYVDSGRLASLHLPNGEFIKSIGRWHEVKSKDGLVNYTEYQNKIYSV